MSRPNLKVWKTYEILEVDEFVEPAKNRNKCFEFVSIYRCSKQNARSEVSKIKIQTTSPKL